MIWIQPILPILQFLQNCLLYQYLIAYIIIMGFQFLKLIWSLKSGYTGPITQLKLSSTLR